MLLSYTSFVAARVRSMAICLSARKDNGFPLGRVFHYDRSPKGDFSVKVYIITRTPLRECMLAFNLRIAVKKGIGMWDIS